MLMLHSARYTCALFSLVCLVMTHQTKPDKPKHKRQAALTCPTNLQPVLQGYAVIDYAPALL